MELPAPAAAATATDQERIARLEERVGIVHALVSEIRTDQKEMADAISRASGGLKVLMLVGGLAGVAGAARGLAALIASWAPQGH